MCAEALVQTRLVMLMEIVRGRCQWIRAAVSTQLAVNRVKRLLVMLMKKQESLEPIAFQTVPVTLDAIRILSTAALNAAVSAEITLLKELARRQET